MNDQVDQQVAWSLFFKWMFVKKVGFSFEEKMIFAWVLHSLSITSIWRFSGAFTELYSFSSFWIFTKNCFTKTCCSRGGLCFNTCKVLIIFPELWKLFRAFKAFFRVLKVFQIFRAFKAFSKLWKFLQSFESFFRAFKAFFRALKVFFPQVWKFFLSFLCILRSFNFFKRKFFSKLF